MRLYWMRRKLERVMRRATLVQGRILLREKRKRRNRCASCHSIRPKERRERVEMESHSNSTVNSLIQCMWMAIRSWILPNMDNGGCGSILVQPLTRVDQEVSSPEILDCDVYLRQIMVLKREQSQQLSIIQIAVEMLTIVLISSHQTSWNQSSVETGMAI